MGTARRTRRTLAVGLAVLGLGALGLASAAQLTVAPTVLQAGEDVVATCQPADEQISVTTVTQLRDGAYVVTGVRVDGVAQECDGLQFKARLLRTDGSTVGAEWAGTLQVPQQPFVVPVSPAVPAGDWGGVSAVIHG